MKRLLVIFSLIAALFVANSCSHETNLSVTAFVELDGFFSFSSYYELKDSPVRIGPVKIGSVFHNNHFSDSDLTYIFTEVMKGNTTGNYTTAILHLEVRDAVSDKRLREETYGVVVNGSGGYDFANMDIAY